MSEQTLPPPEPVIDPATSTDIPPAVSPYAPSGSPVATTTAEVPPKRSGLPRWVPLAALAIFPAFALAGLVYFLAGGKSGGNSEAAAVVDGFLRLGGSDDPGSIQSYTNGFPPGYPSDLPQYPGANRIATFSMTSTRGNTYFAVYTSSDNVAKIGSYFTDRLDKDPWQVSAAQASSTSSGVRFTKPSDADIDGSISINHSDLASKTTIYVSVQDSSTSGKGSPPAKTTFKPQPSLSLPPGFPNDIPIFKDSNQSNVIESLFQRDSGVTNYLISFLTKSNQGDVLDFYKKEFQKRGWTVTDSTSSPASSFAQGIDFQDGPAKAVQGTISADKFTDDNSYTKVDLELQVSSSRGKGN